jgi:hypothetical protein
MTFPQLTPALYVCSGAVQQHHSLDTARDAARTQHQYMGDHARRVAGGTAARWHRTGLILSARSALHARPYHGLCRCCALQHHAQDHRFSAGLQRSCRGVTICCGVICCLPCRLPWQQCYPAVRRQALNVGIYRAIGNPGVYYGFKLGHHVPWHTGFPFNVVSHPQYVGSALTVWGAVILVRHRKHILSTSLSVCGTRCLGILRALEPRTCHVTARCWRNGVANASLMSLLRSGILGSNNPAVGCNVLFVVEL